MNADAAGTPMRFAISEFNVHTAGQLRRDKSTRSTPRRSSPASARSWPSSPTTSPTSYTSSNSAETPGITAGTVKKNGTHFVDNGNAPYNIGGETKGGAVVRLFAKSFAGAKDLFNIPATSGTGATDLRIAASHDTQRNTYSIDSPPTKAPALTH